MVKATAIWTCWSWSMTTRTSGQPRGEAPKRPCGCQRRRRGVCPQRSIYPRQRGDGSSPRLWPAEQSLESGRGSLRLLWTRSAVSWNSASWRSSPTGVWLTHPWAASAEPPLFFDSMVNPCNSTLLQAGRDGQADLVGIVEAASTHLTTAWRCGVWTPRAWWQATPCSARRSARPQGRPPSSATSMAMVCWTWPWLMATWKRVRSLVVLIGQMRWRCPFSKAATGCRAREAFGQRGARRRPQRRWGRRPGRAGAEWGRRRSASMALPGVPGGAFVFINQMESPTAVQPLSAGYAVGILSWVRMVSQSV